MRPSGDHVCIRFFFRYIFFVLEFHIAKKKMMLMLMMMANEKKGFLKTGSKGSAQGNFGLMDLVAAIHWLRENLPAFNGDPSEFSNSLTYNKNTDPDTRYRCIKKNIFLFYFVRKKKTS